MSFHEATEENSSGHQNEHPTSSASTLNTYNNPTFSEKWTKTLLNVRIPINFTLQFLSGIAARNPIKVICTTIFLSFTILIIGLFTNFYVETDSDLLWTPTPSKVLSHGKWLEEDAGFPATPRITHVIVHADGQNVLGKEGIERAFTALDVVRNTDGYDDVCKQAPVSMQDENGDSTCFISSPLRFWDYSLNEFQDNIESDLDVIETLSEETYPDGTPVDEVSILGHPERDSDGRLTTAQLLIMNIPLPRIDESYDLEGLVIANIKTLRDTWESEGSSFHCEISTYRTFDDEFERALVKDIPLVPMIFVVMSIFTCVIFFRRGWVNSRSILGFGAVFTVLLSIFAGYGILFIAGVPFTSMVQILPFIMFGIGLDDAFIIWGVPTKTQRVLNAYTTRLKK